MLRITRLLAIVLLVENLYLVRQVSAEDPAPRSPLIGRWDLTVQGTSGDYPSWLEIRLSGYRTLVGSYVGQFGSARPISKVEVDGNRFRFVIPPQWEKRTTDVVFEGSLVDQTISGETEDEHGKTLSFRGVRSPDLIRDRAPRWGEPLELFNGRDLTGWKTLLPVPNGWKVQDGILINAEPGNNLATERHFDDFKLHVEFRYPAKSNSGIYLRGRYEVQIEDNFGMAPESHLIGGVYGFLTPNINAARPAGAWQEYDITLIGRVVTISLNGEKIIDRQSIPGITGGAIDSREADPGPIYLQGDHGPIEFRKITITPGSSS